MDNFSVLSQRLQTISESRNPFRVTEVFNKMFAHSMSTPQVNPILFTQLEQKIQQKNLLHPLDILVVGATGTGKSSTINALAGGECLTAVGDGVAPRTEEISAHKLTPYLRLHDSAGLGDGLAADRQHACNIIRELTRTCTAENVASVQYGLIDMVLVILDGGSRDLGTTFNLLREVIVKNIDPKRIIVAINQADMSSKGRGWDSLKNCPEPTLQQRLTQQAQVIQQRIKEATDVQIPRPIYYSAAHGYNLDAILTHIIAHLPSQRRTLSTI